MQVIGIGGLLYFATFNLLYNRASAHYTKEKYRLALRELDWATRLVPKSSGIYLGRGMAYFQLEDYSHAIADFE